MLVAVDVNDDWRSLDHLTSFANRYECRIIAHLFLSALEFLEGESDCRDQIFERRVLQAV